MPSRDPEASAPPPGEAKDSEVTPEACSTRAVICSRVSGSHRMTVRSQGSVDPEARVAPSGENDTEVTPGDVPFQGAEPFPALHVPQHDRPIRRPGSEGCAIRGKRHRHDRTRVPGEGPDLFPGFHVPQNYLPIPRPRKPGGRRRGRRRPN